MSYEPLLPDLADLRRPPRTTVRLARGASVVAVVGLGMAVLLGVASPIGRASVVVVTAVAVAVVARATSRGPDGRAPADVPWVRSAIAIALVGATFAVLVLDLGLVSRTTVLVFGVVAVTAAFVLPSPHRELVATAAVVAWVGALVLEGTTATAVLATHVAGGGLLAASTGRTARVAEAAIADRAAAAAAAGTRTVLVAAVLRMESLEPARIEQALLDAARQLGLRGPMLHHAATTSGTGSPPADPVAAEVLATGRRAQGPQRAGHGAVVGVPLTADGELLAALTAVIPEPGATGRVEALELLAEEAGRALGRAHRYVEDTATVDELRRLEALTQDVVSTVSHELRTPVTVIAGLGQTLARRWDDLTPERRADLLRRVDANADRLATMVRSLLDTSELESGELTAHPEPLDLRTLVADVVGRLSSVTAPREVEVEVTSGTWVAADPGLLRHALENLLGNAAQHTPPQGTTIVVRASREGDQVRLEVVDDGPGIAAEDLPHVRQRFYRAGPSRVARPGGLGLGLALVEQILRLHGRELTIDSQPGQGASFSFVLTAVDEPAPSATSS